MLKYILCLLLLTFISNILFSQQYDPNIPPNTFRSEANPHYWKNKKPHADYWQQDVYYKVKAEINEHTDIITGTEELTYWNNSPDTLEYVYFHLYQNAFQPGSYLNQLQKDNNRNTTYGKYEKQGLGTEILSLSINGETARQELDNTILKVWLPEPLLPDGSINFNIAFQTYFDSGGNNRRRMKMYNSWGFKHYNGVLWYPRIAVYDRKFGWTADQHFDKEFYGDFGTFDVELTFASNFIVDATGTLLNRNEVLPDSLRRKLDLYNFLNKPWESTPSVIIPYDPTERKTWHFYAENIHDFAFTADPTYRIGEITWRKIKAVALVQEPHAAGWIDAAPFTISLIKWFSENVGDYVWPKIIVADARDGMEYNMLALCGGFAPYYYDLLAHEVAHMWFYGMVGNNETYRAPLDEGLSQFIDAHALVALTGPYMPKSNSPNFYLQRFTEPETVMDEELYRGYLAYAMRGEDAPLNTHSSMFNSSLRHEGGYRHVYYKMGVMLSNLEYVLGKELFWQALQHYFAQWSFCHPYFEDFRQSFIDYTGTDLNWFFDQWMETEKKIDYAVKNVKRDGDQEYQITFERKEEMQMPIDFAVITETDTLHYHIPNTNFIKNTTATVLPKWVGWQNFNTEYTATVAVPGKIKDVIIDPTQRLADINMLNNSKKIPIDFDFDSKIYNPSDWKTYELRWRPDLWYNAFDGIKAGVHLDGDYMQRKHVFSFTGWWNTGFLQNIYNSELIPEHTHSGHDLFSFIASYTTALDKINRKMFWHISGRMLDGINMLETGINGEITDRSTYNIFFKGFYVQSPVDLLYLNYQNEWLPDHYNNSLNINLSHRYYYHKGMGKLNLDLRSASLFSDFNYSYATLEAVNKNGLGKIGFNTRIFGRLGSGDPRMSGSALYFAGASPEKLLDNKYTRAKGFFPPEWAVYQETVNHFHHGGGLNLRGYAGYLVSEKINGEAIRAYKGNSGAAVNIELEFDDLIKVLPRLESIVDLDLYLFADAGFVSAFYKYDPLTTDRPKNTLIEPRADAGIGAALNINRFWVLETVKPLVLRFDVPFYISHAPFEEPENFKFRWVFGINRAF